MHSTSNQASDSFPDEVPVFTEEPASVVQKLGGSVSLRCSARPALANISWRLNGQELLDGDLGAVLGPNSLYIPSLSNLTLGRYQCVASTGVGALASVLANVTAASEYPQTFISPREAKDANIFRVKRLVPPTRMSLISNTSCRSPGGIYSLHLLLLASITI